MRDTSTTIALKLGASFSYSLSFFLKFGLVVNLGVAQSRRYRIDDGFKQTDEGRQLRLWQTVNQLVSVLAIAHGAFLLSSRGSSLRLRDLQLAKTAKYARCKW